MDTTPFWHSLSAATRQKRIAALSPLAYDVTQNNGTEPPFYGANRHQKKEGIYIDIISSEPLFCTQDQFDSGSGWPSFTQPISTQSITEHPDNSAGMQRIEVRSRIGNCHLGHVFPDGPPPTGKRYCINAIALDFIPKDLLASQGYDAFLNRFS